MDFLIRSDGTAMALLTEVPNTFSIGLLDRTDYPEVHRRVRSAIKPLAISQGTPQERSSPPTVSTGAAIQPTLVVIAVGIAAIRRLRRLRQSD